MFSVTCWPNTSTERNSGVSMASALKAVEKRVFQLKLYFFSDKFSFAANNYKKWHHTNKGRAE